MPAPAVELLGVTKRFGSVVANDRVDVRVEAGTIHGIIGENGAGKSTLMNILYGYYQADAGSILIDGEPRRIDRPVDAIRAGIGMVHQHFMLVDPFTVLENVLLGAEGGLLLHGGAQRLRAELGRLGRDYGLEVDPDARVSELPVGLQQRVEILKALCRGARILILDEPTAVLTPQEADELFRILAGLRAQGRTIILITHKLREIMAAADHVSVMRGGRMVAHRRTADTSRDELAELMVGRKVEFRPDRRPSRTAEFVLEVSDLEVADDRGVPRVKGVSLGVRAGEIVGIAGVAGNGQSELLEAIAGIRAPVRGEIRLQGERLGGPVESRPPGLGHVPEDRIRVGLVPSFSAAENVILGYHRRTGYVAGGLLRRRTITETCARLLERYDIRPRAPTLPAIAFSGGNQQKLVLARELEHDPALLLVGQPTRGVDIGAIEFIHAQLVAMRDAGKALLLVSVELDEVLSLSDRILVMFGGRLVGEIAAGEADERRIGLLMAGIHADAA